MGDDDWRQQIRIKLTKLYADDESRFRDYMDLLEFFNREVTMENESTYYTSPFNQTLKMALEGGKDHVFVAYCERMMTDVRKVTRDPSFRKAMEEIYNQFALPEDLQHNEGTLEKFMTTLKKRVPVLSVVLLPLAPPILTADIIHNIRLWWKDEISSQRCAKACTDSLNQLAGMAAGAAGGALIGGLVLPGFGLVVGGAIGAVLVGFSARVVSEYVTNNIFNLPKDVALENSYRFLGVHWKASNNEVNRAYYRLAELYHPDRKGKENDFKKLMFHMEIIRKARE